MLCGLAGGQRSALEPRAAAMADPAAGPPPGMGQEQAEQMDAAGAGGSRCWRAPPGQRGDTCGPRHQLIPMRVPAARGWRTERSGIIPHVRCIHCPFPAPQRSRQRAEDGPAIFGVLPAAAAISAAIYRLAYRLLHDTVETTARHLPCRADGDSGKKAQKPRNVKTPLQKEVLEASYMSESPAARWSGADQARTRPFAGAAASASSLACKTWSAGVVWVRAQH